MLPRIRPALGGLIALFLLGVLPAPPAAAGPYGEPKNLAAVLVHSKHRPADAFRLASRPGAPRTIFLNFVGADLSVTRWSSQAVAAPPFDMDGRPTAFSPVERRVIVAAWETVAEDFAPFNVNVTTLRPPRSDLIRSSEADQRYGVEVVVTHLPEGQRPCSCGGIAPFDSAHRVSDLTHRVGFAFSSGRLGSAAFTARHVGETISHEAGHMWGLRHHGLNGAEYHPGSRGWGPIMGSPDKHPLTRWSNGRYDGASQTTNDVAVLGVRLGYAADDHADDRRRATHLPVPGSREGVIGARPSGVDVDTFALRVAGPTLVSVRPTGIPANLDVGLVVRNAAGRVVARRNPKFRPQNLFEAHGLSAQVVLRPRAKQQQTWTVTVRGAKTGAFGAYGSMGRYRVTAVRLPAAARLSLAARPRKHRVAAPGTMYRARPLKIAGGRKPFSYSISGLPSEFTVLPGGRVRGYSNTPRVFSGLYRVEDADGRAAQRRFQIRIEWP